MISSCIYSPIFRPLFFLFYFSFYACVSLFLLLFPVMNKLNRNTDLYLPATSVGEWLWKCEHCIMGRTMCNSVGNQCTFICTLNYFNADLSACGIWSGWLRKGARLSAVCTDYPNVSGLGADSRGLLAEHNMSGQAYVVWRNPGLPQTEMWEWYCLMVINWRRLTHIMCVNRSSDNIYLIKLHNMLPCTAVSMQETMQVTYICMKLQRSETKIMFAIMSL